MIKLLIIGMMDIKGGIEQLIYQIVSRFDKSKIHCDFLCYCRKCAYEEDLVAAGSTVYHVTKRGENPVKCRKELKLFFQTRPKEYDYIWINTCSASDAAAHVYIKRYTNAQLITHSHNTFFDATGVRRAVHMLLHRMNRRKFLKYTDYRFACSAAAGEWLFGAEAKEITIVRNGIETDRFRFDRAVSLQLRQEFSLENCHIIGHAGRFCEAKNHTFILDIFACVLKKSENYRLFLAGEGELLVQMRQKAQELGIADKVIFAGYRNDMERILQMFDILLFPSLFEGLGIIAVEAQASGLPCLISDTVPKEVFLTELVTAMSLAEPAERWAEKLDELVKTNEKTDRTSYCNIVAQNGYDIDETTAELERFFLEHRREDREEQ